MSSEISVNVWQQDGSGVFTGGDIGGDYQVTESYTVRYVNPAKPGALVDVYFYGEAVTEAGEEKRGEYRVAKTLAYTVCTDMSDPGGTEEFADYIYMDADPGKTFRTVMLAEGAARRRAGEYTGAEITWNGEPFHSGGPISQATTS